MADNRKVSRRNPIILSENLFPVVGIGASAGGLEAFKKLVCAIPEDSGIAYVLVQHLDPSHESLLPGLLQKITNVPVIEISDEIKVLPNHIYILPSNKMLLANDGVLKLSPRPGKNNNKLNLPIDVFFTSLATIHKSHAIGVVLSGTGTDGTRGLNAIKEQGGLTFAQDEVSATFEAMPASAVQQGVVDFILPPELIPPKIIEIKKQLLLGTQKLVAKLTDVEAFDLILSFIRVWKGTDFTHYKQSTIHRRILRRMAISKKEGLTGYFQFLQENKPEQDALFLDLLIPVTAFFRDQKVFDHLSESIFPKLIMAGIPGEPIRVWVVGCSTGQEAYSIAIGLKEVLGESPQKIQVFASDISDPAIAKARKGIYTDKETEDLGRVRLQEFFNKVAGGYQVKKEIRDMCVFAVHNFLKDPPFGRMNLVSCRNVLIYLKPVLQKKALTTFHYALNTKGYLLLGKSESSEVASGLFEAAGKNNKLFIRREVPSKFVLVPNRRGEESLQDYRRPADYQKLQTDFQNAADELVLSKYTPAGVVINQALDIVQFRGTTSDYLQQSAGEPSHNLLKLTKNGLAFELRSLFYKVKKLGRPVIKDNVTVQVGGSQHVLSIAAIPLANLAEPHYLILFHRTFNPADAASLQVNSNGSAQKKKVGKDLRIQQLEREMVKTYQDIRIVTENQETAYKELQGANEELLSGSEELQSLNEELQASKEELQSTNEELSV